ncbi:Hemicentin-1 [Amphibalanus amphitrite]|uniref:Hemicentin-1 n=1 Tax=Amphibalanus amphitrite TaxID=1232801 RepID=A0A6A4X186_AMPAM|nr:Hemicentin-1 [Amphibalanus amphitrite]
MSLIVSARFVEEEDYDIKKETTTVINNYMNHYRQAVSKAFKPRSCVFSNRAYDYRGVVRQALGDFPCQSWSIGQDDLSANWDTRGFMHRYSLIDGHVGGQGYCRVAVNSMTPPSCVPFFDPKIKPCMKSAPPFCPGVETAECRYTGNGQEYQGKQNRTQSGRVCLPWKTAYNYVKSLIGDAISQEPFLSTMNNLQQHFPELREFMYQKNIGPDIWWSKVNHNYCRNWYPWSTNGRDNGPYCFVYTDNVPDGRAWITVESCDIPFCDEKPDDCTFITRGSNVPFDFMIPLPFTSTTADNTVRFSIRSWTIEYPIHARFKFTDSTSILQRGYYFYIGPVDTVASRINPMLQNGKFMKWRQYSPNKTMAVEWRNIYFKFSGGTRSIEFGDVLDTGTLEPILQFDDVDFVSPQFVSFRSGLEASPFCPHTISNFTYENRDKIPKSPFWFWLDLQIPRREVLSLEENSELYILKIVRHYYFYGARMMLGYQHPYKDCQFNFVRSRLMVHVPHVCGACQEITLDGSPFLLHRIPRRPSSPDDQPEYEIKFTLRGRSLSGSSPRIFLLHQAGAYPQWTVESNDTVDWDWEQRWGQHHEDGGYVDADYLGAADFHTSSPGYIIDFLSDETGEPKLTLSSNVDLMSRYFAITQFPYISKGMRVYYTVHCIPEKRQQTPAYPDCVLTHDDPKFSGQWSLSRDGFSCARWDDPLVQDYESPALEDLLKGIKIDENSKNIKKTGFDAYKSMRKDLERMLEGNSYMMPFTSMDQLLKLQQLAGNPDNYPDGSIASAGNNCRNLGASSETGPFCFVYLPYLAHYSQFLWPLPARCSVPRCHFSACRGTLAGHEYRGPASTDALHRPCLAWSRERLQQVYGSLNTDDAQERLGDLMDELDGSQRCANAILEPSGTDPGSIECLSGEDSRPRAACHVPICQMGGCTVLVAFDEKRDTQNYMRVLGSDPKMLLFGLRHMSVASDEGDGSLLVEFTDLPSDASDRESLIIEIGFQVEIKYKAKTESEHTSLIFKVFPGLIRVLGLQYVWIGVDDDEVRFGKDKDFRNPLLTAPIKRNPTSTSDVFHFISFSSADVMALDWGCGSRCPVWYLTSQSRLYEHYLTPEAPGPGRWSIKLRVSIRWTDDFPPSDGQCASGRKRGGMSLTFSESPFGMSSASDVVFTIEQGEDVSVQLRHYKQGSSGKVHESKPKRFTGPNNDCGECWTHYDVKFESSRSEGTVSWSIWDAAGGRIIGDLNIKDYNDRLKAFLPVSYHAAATEHCQQPVNVAFNCTPPEKFDVERVDGGWDAWSPWDCSAPCDGGFGARDRHCRSPPPNFWGHFCEGEPFEMGVCNDFKCGEFNPDMVDRLRDAMRTAEAVTVTRYAGGGVRLTCSGFAAELARNAMPDLETRWYFNRSRIDLYRWVDMSGGDLYREGLTPDDTGVYICNLVTPEPVRDEHTAQLTALIVRSPEPTLRVREGDRLEFSCHIDMVGLVFSELSQRWLLNGHLFRDLGVTSPSDTDLFSERATSALAGVWECQVSATALNLTWTTAWQRVRVLARRTWMTDLRESIFYQKMTELHGIRLWISLAVLVGGLAVFCGGYLWFARRTMRKEAAEVAAYLRSGDMDAATVREAGVSLAELGVTPEDEEEEGVGEEAAAAAGATRRLGSRRRPLRAA